MSCVHLNAVKTGGKPLVAGEEGYQALEIVLSVYQACREERKILLG